MVFQFYSDEKTNPSIYIITNNNGKLEEVYSLSSYPLLGEYDLKNFTYPNRQQLHSKRNYIKNTYKYIKEVEANSLGDVINEAKILLIEEHPYASNDKE